MKEMISELRQQVQTGASVEQLNALCRNLIEQEAMKDCPESAKAAVQTLCRTVSLPIETRVVMPPAERPEPARSRQTPERRDLIGYSACVATGLLFGWLTHWYTAGIVIGGIVGLAIGVALDKRRSDVGRKTDNGPKFPPSPRIAIVSTPEEIARMAEETIRAIRGIVSSLPASESAMPEEPYPLETKKYLRVLRWLQNEYQLCLAKSEVDEIKMAGIEQVLRGCGYSFVEYAEGLEPYFDLTPASTVDRICTTLPAVMNAMTQEFILRGHAIYPYEKP